MAINWQQIVGAGTPPEDVEAAQRRLALAEALQAKAIRGTAPGGGGRVVAKYGTGHALADLANGVVSGRNVSVAEKSLARQKEAEGAKLDEAIAAYSRAVPDQQVPQAAVQELRRTPDGQLMEPVMSQSEGVAGIAKAGGLDSRKALAEALMKQGIAANDPSAIADRNLKAYQIEGTLEERRLAREQRMSEIQAQIDARLQAGRDAADLRRQLAEMQAETAREAERGRNERSAADREARGAAATEKEKDKQDGRLAALEATNAALVRVQATSDRLGKGGGAIEGQAPAMGALTQDFDGAKAQLLAAIQSALRVPGIGSQSNMELQALMAALPERTQEWGVRNEQIKGIATRLKIIMQRELGMEAPPPPGGAAAAPGAAPPAAAPVTKMLGGKTYEKGADGQWYERTGP